MKHSLPILTKIIIMMAIVALIVAILVSLSLVPAIKADLAQAGISGPAVDMVFSPAYLSNDLIVLSLCAVAIAFVVGLVFSRTIIKPLRQLQQGLQELERGNLDCRVDLATGDEFEHLADTFNTLTTRLRDLIDSLETRVEMRTAQLQASADVGRAATSILDPDELFEQVVRLITERFGFYYAAVFTLDVSGRWAVLREANGPGDAPWVLKQSGHKLEVGGQSMVGMAIQQRRPRIAHTVGTEPTRYANPLLPATRSEAALPLMIGDRVLGALDVQSAEETALDEASVSVLQSVADQIAIALGNAASYAEAQRSIETLNGLLALSRDLAGSRSVQDLAQRTSSFFETLVGVDTYYLALYDEANQQIRFVMRWRAGTATMDDRSVRPLGNWRTDYVVRTGQILRMSTAEAPQRMAELSLQTSAPTLSAYLGVPIISGEHVLGMIGMEDAAPDAAFTDSQEKLTVAMANQLATALENMRLAEEAQHTLDELNALNRRLTGEAWQARSLETQLSYEYRRSATASTGAPVF
jgi:GAF domain-containing protein/HAMP domain-containing protein